MARIVGEVRPRFVFVENSPALVGRGLARVLADLAALGYDARWGVVSARDAGAPHLRERLWIVADNDRNGGSGLVSPVDLGIPGQWRTCGKEGLRAASRNPFAPNAGWPQPLLRRGDDGLANRMDRTRCIGNGQVPQAAALAWRLLNETRPR